MPSLVDERYGPAAVDVLGQLHNSYRLAQLERRVDSLYRELAYALRVPRGFNLNFPADGSTGEDTVEWDRQQRVRVTSEDGSVTITNGTREDPSQIDLAAGGCLVSFSEVVGDTGTCTADSCDSSITFSGGYCISTVVDCTNGDATVTISYIGNHYKTVQGDEGQADALGCDDTIKFVGGACIKTTAAEGSPDTVTIDFDGYTWSSIITDDGTATPADPGCSNALNVNGGLCIATSVVGGAVLISFTGSGYGTVNGNVGTAYAAGCGDTISIVGDGSIVCTTAVDGSPDTLTIQICFKTCPSVIEGGGMWTAGAPAGWLYLPMSEAGCPAAPCSLVAVPYWYCAIGGGGG